ncbi:GPW/gp25 family protein [Helicobacter salomonis]|uniref:GPW/gp25 family protein n=1 Tax=Helicobacter salomonis TaxID=56878 RepID=UPI000CF076C0|nr:GPW/gp25 family protein [Helicobacter salomonis]
MYLLSVEEHIDRLLRTTKNTLILAPHVGLSPIFIDRVSVQDELILDLKDEVLENLENFEPRVQAQHLSVQHDEKGLRLHVHTIDTRMDIAL